jgi:DNA recombination protein RmuC
MVVGLLIGLVLGAVATWFVVRAQYSAKVAVLATSRESLSDTMRTLAADALATNNDSFLQLAKAQLEQLQQKTTQDLEQRKQAVEHLVSPIKESLAKVDGKLQALEVARVGAYSALTTQVKSLSEAHALLRDETGNLVSALRDRPNVRGRWGEIQLRRVVEMAGMLEHCDFETQHHVATEDGHIRPDLVVKLAGGGSIVVDAKFVAQAYLESLDCRDEDERTAKLRDHARQLRDQIGKLSAKTYWSQFARSPELVVLFIPGQNFLDAALQHDPRLLDDAIKQRVLIATPTSLIGLLWTSAFGWREERIAESAKELSNLGAELYDRLAKFTKHIVGVGRGIESAARSYNDAVGSLEGRVLPSARKFKEHGIAPTAEIAELKVVETAIRPVTAPEFPASADAA